MTQQSANTAMTWVEALVRAELEKHELFLAEVTAASAGKVTIKRYGALTAEKAYGRIRGFHVNVGDVVVMQRLGSDLIVLGSVQSTLPSFLNIEAALKVKGGPIIESGTGSPEGVVTATVGSIYLRIDGAAGTIIYEKYSGAGNTGWRAVGGTTLPITTGTGTPEGVVTAAVGSLFLRTDGALGTIIYEKASGAGNTGWVANGVGAVVYAHEVQDTATDSTNASTGTYDTNVDGTLTLPAGTWTVLAVTSQGCTNSAISAVRFRTEIDANAGSYWQLLCDSGLPVIATTAHLVTGKTGGGNVTIEATYAPATTGTAGGKGGSWWAMAFRTA
jgi:hypothetical protein